MYMETSCKDFGNIGSVLDEALNGAEIPETPVELSPKEKERHERWLKKRAEQEELAKKRAEEVAAAKERRRIADQCARKAEATRYDLNPQQAPAKKSSTTPIVASSDRGRNMSREEREAAREAELLSWMEFVEDLDPKSITCCPDDQITVSLDKYVRDYSNSKKYLVTFNMAVRPTFLLSDQDDPKIKYRAWKRITPDTIILEFGEQVPWKFNRETKERYRDDNGTPKKYFAVKHYDAESGEIKSGLFLYEREENEFEAMKSKLESIFSNIIPENRKRFIDFKTFLDKKTRGSFTGKLDTDVLNAISTFLKNGGSSQNAMNIHLKAGANGILFDPAGVYILVNMSHRHAGMLNPQEALDNKVANFYTNKGKVGLHVPSHMAVIDLSPTGITFVYGA